MHICGNLCLVMKHNDIRSVSLSKIIFQTAFKPFHLNKALIVRLIIFFYMEFHLVNIFLRYRHTHNFPAVRCIKLLFC